MRALRIAIVLALIFLFRAISFAGDLLTKEAPNYYNEAVEAQQKGDLLAAKSNYAKALLTDNISINAQKFIANNTGVIYAQQGDLDKAEDRFIEALRLCPDYKLAQLNLGLIYDKQIDTIKAIQYWLKLSGFNLEEAKPKTFVLLSPDDYSGKEMILADTQNINSQKIILNNSGVTYALNGSLRMAERKFNEALKLDPDYRTAKINLGLIYDKRPNKLKALEYWIKLFNINLSQIKPEGFILEDTNL